MLLRRRQRDVLIGGPWTAATSQLPLSVVIVNNGGYRIIKQRLLAFHGDDHYVGLDFADPPVDFAGVVHRLGWK